MNIENGTKLHELLQLFEICDRICKKLDSCLNLPCNTAFNLPLAREIIAPLMNDSKTTLLKNSVTHKTQITFLKGVYSQIKKNFLSRKIAHDDKIKICTNISLMENILRKKLKQIPAFYQKQIYESFLPNFSFFYSGLKEKKISENGKDSPYYFQTQEQNHENLQISKERKQYSLTRPSSSNPLRKSKNARESFMRKPKKRMSTSLHICDLQPHPRKISKRCNTAFINKISIKKSYCMSGFHPSYRKKNEKQENKNELCRYESEKYFERELPALQSPKEKQSNQSIKMVEGEEEQKDLIAQVFQEKNLKNYPSDEQIKERRKKSSNICRKAVLKRRGSIQRRQSGKSSSSFKNSVEKNQKSIKFADEINLQAPKRSSYRFRRETVRPKLKRKNKHTVYFHSVYKQKPEGSGRYYKKMKDRVKQKIGTKQKVNKRKNKYRNPLSISFSQTKSKLLIRVESQKTQKNSSSKRKKSFRSQVSSGCKQMDNNLQNQFQQKQSRKNNLSTKRIINKSEYLASRKVVAHEPYRYLNNLKNEICNFREHREHEKTSMFFFQQEQFSKKQNLKLQRYIIEKYEENSLQGGGAFVIPSYITDGTSEKITKNYRDFIFEADESWLNNFKEEKNRKQIMGISCQ